MYNNKWYPRIHVLCVCFLLEQKILIIIQFQHPPPIFEKRRISNLFFFKLKELIIL